MDHAADTTLRIHHPTTILRELAVARLEWPRARQINDIRRMLEANDAAARADADVYARLRAITLASTNRSISGHLQRQLNCAASCAHDPAAAVVARYQALVRAAVAPHGHCH